MARKSAHVRRKAAPEAPAPQPAGPGPAMQQEEGFFHWDGDTLVVNVLGKPAAARDAIGKPKGTQLKISVTASPKNGKATDHMLRFLAPLFGVPVSAIVVVFGRESIHKQLRIQSPTRLPAVFAAANPDA
jgi:uncharacterized protein